MKTPKNFRSLAMTVGLLLLAAAANAQSFLTNGLVAYYPFEGNASDAAGTNHGTVNGATLTTNRLGQFNAAYSFNGTGSRIDFTSPPFTQTTNWTLSAWVRPGSLGQEGMVVHVGADNGATGDGYGLGLRPSGWDALISNVGWYNSGVAPANTNDWQHVVVQRGGGQYRFFVNGVPAATAAAGTIFTPSDFTIGGQNGTRYFRGVIDEVRIYNRALATNEVAQLFLFTEQCVSRTARATAVMAGGFVVGATLTDTGCGYTNAPLVLILGGGGSNATATATISDGRVTAVNITSPGGGYTNTPIIRIASPPFLPTVSIAISKVAVTQNVLLGRRYVLEASPDLSDWAAVGPAFIAESETYVTEVAADANHRYFRLQEVP